MSVEITRDEVPRERPPRILISAASGKVPLVRAMKDAARRLSPKAEVICGDMDPGALTKYIADDFWVMPETTQHHLNDIYEGCLQRGINVVLPTRDGELQFWSDAKEEFETAGIHVIVSPSTSVSRCLDKFHFGDWGISNGLPFIPARLTLNDLGPGPYVVKERYGAGSLAIGLDLDRNAALQHAKTLEFPVFQPFIKGSEISIDTWVDRSHHPRGVILRERNTVKGGEAKVTTTFRDTELELELLRFLSLLRLWGPVVLQAVIDPEGKMWIIECNTRFGGASTASIAVGLDSLYWSLAEAFLSLPEPDFNRESHEVCQLLLTESHMIRMPATEAN